jgi:SpoIID/LytB domain protein
VHAESTKPAKKKFHVIVARLPNDAERAQSEMELWRGRGFSPKRFEIGTVFAVRGALFDSRRLLITVAPADDEATAKRSAAEIAAKFHADASLYPELIERPKGTLIAVDERGTSITNDAILWFRGDDLLEVGAKKYAGKIYVTLDNSGALAVVNAVPEDRLLAGLVPAEMSASSPPEALKAQAVAARNELLAKIGTRHLTDPYRLCSSVHCQVYAGAGHEDARSTAAVTATRGEFLVRQESGQATQLVDAVYSASCGGHTEDNDKVWGGAADASLRGKLDGNGALVVDEKNLENFLAHPPDSWCAHAKESGSAFRWQKELDLPEIENRTGLGKLRAIEVLSRGVSGRVGKLRLAGSGGMKEVSGELEVRKILGNLKSALFKLTLERDGSGIVTAAHVEGGGHGHGIGMCQLGAVGMALAGKSYKEILQHYYAASHLERLY